tara:strand:- start:1386 stop:2384 length:999 start_codon:yes stop_codon:yes gene_type:complete
MGFKFPNIRPETKEIVEPDDLNQNLKPFVDEINGNLTHENLSDFDLNQGMFEDNSFSDVFQSSFVSEGEFDVLTNGYQCSKTSPGFTRVDKAGKKMPSIDFIADRDGYIIVDFFCSFIWRGNGLLDKEEASQYGLIKEHYPVTHADVIHHTDQTSGGWIGTTGSTATPFDGVLKVFRSGSDDDSAGYYTSVFKTQDFPQGRWVIESNDRFGIKLRVLSNGHEICESGWIRNGTDRNSVFLTGVLPVRAGVNEIRSEVAAAMIVNNFGTSTGVRAKEGTTKGKFFPKSTFSARDVLFPLPEQRKINYNQNVDITLGIDCSVTASNLVVQFRKC